LKHLRETFTDEEFERLLKAKNRAKKNWHDLLLWALPAAVEWAYGMEK